MTPEIGTRIDFEAEGINVTDFLCSLKRELNERELAFWNNNPPEFIVLATASLRKSYLVFLASYNFDFTQVPAFVPGMSVAQEFSVKNTHPLVFEGVVEDKIRNGDGTIQPGTMLFLGYLYGVPVIVDPQTGETTENDNAIEQSRNKAKSISDLPRYQETDALFVSSDTVGWVDTPYNHAVSLGKPGNHQFYPKQKTSENNDEFTERKQAFMFWYLMVHFTSINLPRNTINDAKQNSDFELWYQIAGESLESAKNWVAEMVVKQIESEVELKAVYDLHKNALLLMRGENELVLETVLHHTMSSDRQLAMMILAVNGEQFFPESAGAGVIQKEVFRDKGADKVDYIITDDQMRDYLNTINPELRSWLLLLHLMGVPFWAISLLQELKKL